MRSLGFGRNTTDELRLRAERAITEARHLQHESEEVRRRAIENWEEILRIVRKAG